MYPNNGKLYNAQYPPKVVVTKQVYTSFVLTSKTYFSTWYLFVLSQPLGYLYFSTNTSLRSYLESDATLSAVCLKLWALV